MEDLRPALYLFPSNLSEAPVSDVLPPVNIELISGVKHFIVENVRTARRFLKKCTRDINIDELSFTVLNVNTDVVDIPSLLAPLEQGHDVGVISEAGCPAVADPGALVVAEAHRRGFRVVPLVGPSSILLSLMGSGFNGQSFTFLGYLPIHAAERTAALKQMHTDIMRNNRTQIFIETPYRNNKLIADIIAALPAATRLCVATDLTGPGQRITTLTLAQWRRQQLDYDKIPAIFLLYK
ncbi:SAM-dependent methyltransferase [Muribaculaceae bacterium Isolate-002 (NCI)]|nr:SAM-dependent methyltransferase [Muribaculaceae bacterium Isolate-002 (NCI)]